MTSLGVVDRRMLIVGAGGHAKVVIDVARAAGWYPVAALDPIGVGGFCSDVPIVGGDEKAKQMRLEGIETAVVAIGLNSLRFNIGERLKSIGFSCQTIVHPSATISPSATIEEGTVIMAGAVINASSTIGRFVIINTAAIVEHDCVVGDGAHIAPRSVLGGNVQIGAEVLFGIGSVARPGVIIGSGASIGAGSVVVSAIQRDIIAFGVPAIKIKGIDL